MKYKHFPARFFNHFIQPSPLRLAKLKSLNCVLRGQLPPQKLTYPIVACLPFDNFKIPQPMCSSQSCKYGNYDKTK